MLTKVSDLVLARADLELSSLIGDGEGLYTAERHFWVASFSRVDETDVAKLPDKIDVTVFRISYLTPEMVNIRSRDIRQNIFGLRSLLGWQGFVVCVNGFELFDHGSSCWSQTVGLRVCGEIDDLSS